MRHYRTLHLRIQKAGSRIFVYLIFNFFLFFHASNVLANQIHRLFEKRIELERLLPTSTIQTSTREIWKNRHTLLIPGLINELPNLFSLYYRDQIFVLENDFQSTTQMSRSESYVSTDITAFNLYNTIHREYKRTAKPIVLLGHSKGGVEGLLTVLYHPELIFDGIVDRVVVIQGAVQGSPLADPNQLSVPMKILNFALGEGLYSVSPQRSKANIETALHSFEEYLATRYGKTGQFRNLKKTEFSEKIFYVRSWENHEELGFGIKMILQFCRRNLRSHGENDGLLLADHQKHEAVGIDLGILKADHISLTVSSLAFKGMTTLPLNNFPSDYRIAFSRALFQLIYEPNFANYSDS